MEILPDTPWRHITFTMPCEFWPLFELNRSLLNKLSSLAAKACLKLYKKYGITPGIFTALHTHGRALNFHPHVHLSITLSGLTENGSWKEVKLNKHKLMRAWRYQVITLLRKSYPDLVIPGSLEFEGGTSSNWNVFLDFHYQRHWNIDLQRPSPNAYHTITYLGRYIKRPPVAYSKILHYNDTGVMFRYLNHRTNQHESIIFHSDEFIKNFTQHIHDKGFRVIRYYGFLANRLRKTLLQKVYQALGQINSEPRKVTHASLLQRFVNVNPLRCLLCDFPMRFVSIQRGLSISDLKKFHFQLATMRGVF